MRKDRQENLSAILVVDEAGMALLGERIAASLFRGSIVALHGDLGSGKTTLARAVLRSLGVIEAVPSPTFLLAQRYETARLPVWHFDFYRVERSNEVFELGIEEALAEGALLIEWPENAAPIISGERLDVQLEIVDEARRRVMLRGLAVTVGAIVENWPNVR